MPARFLLYDGITIPVQSASIDFVYSVACLQHVPKPYAYNLFGEILRILRPNGFAAIHLLSFLGLRLWHGFDWRREISQQLREEKVHWHHFYSTEELSYVLQYGYRAHTVNVLDTRDGSIWCAFGPETTNHESLPDNAILGANTSISTTSAIAQGSGLDLQLENLSSRVAELEASINRYRNALPVRWARRLRCALLRSASAAIGSRGTHLHPLDGIGRDLTQTGEVPVY